MSGSVQKKADMKSATLLGTWDTRLQPFGRVEPEALDPDIDVLYIGPSSE